MDILESRRFGRKLFIRYHKPYHYKNDARKKADEFRSEERLARIVKEEGDWYVYSRHK